MLLVGNAILKREEIYNGRFWPISKVKCELGLFYVAVMLAGVIVIGSAHTEGTKSNEVKCIPQSCEGELITCDGELMIAPDGCNTTQTIYYTECKLDSRVKPGSKVYPTEPGCIPSEMIPVQFYIGLGIILIIPIEVGILGIMYVSLNRLRRIREKRQKTYDVEAGNPNHEIHPRDPPRDPKLEILTSGS